MLASLATACRPPHARRWDEAGIVAAIVKVSHFDLANVATAVIRAAADRTIETPGAIANTAASCWDNRPAPTRQRRPPKPVEECLRHPGQYATACGGCRADRDAADTPPAPPERPRASDHAQEWLRAIRDGRVRP